MSRLKSKISNKRMSSFVTRGQELIGQKNTKGAMEIIAEGLQHYSEKILNAISPYAQADAGLVVIALRHMANEIERNNPGTREFVQQMDKCIIKPTLTEITKVQKANQK